MYTKELTAITVRKTIERQEQSIQILYDHWKHLQIRADAEFCATNAEQFEAYQEAMDYVEAKLLRKYRRLACLQERLADIQLSA